MFDRADLRAAVTANVMDAGTAAKFEAFVASRHGESVQSGDGESLRFLANFNDIFISIGIVLLLSGTLAFSGNLFIGDTPTPLRGVATLIPPAGLAWLLSEYFCARRRLLLPSIVLCAFWCAATGIAGSLMFGEAVADDVDSMTDAFQALGNLGIVGGGAVAAGATAYFARFRLPFSLFILAIGLAVIVYSSVAFFGDTQMVIGGTLSLLVGLATLTAAIVLDMGDPQRTQRLSDHAFWLHLAAAPQIILGLRGLTIGFFGEGESIESAAILLASLLGFAFMSLALNRRALIVSSLLTYGIALGALIGGMGLGMVNTTIFTLILLGSAVVLIGGGWSTARKIVLGVLPRGGVFDRVFPPELSSFARA